jgi:hypothetical protein
MFDVFLATFLSFMSRVFDRMAAYPTNLKIEFACRCLDRPDGPSRKARRPSDVQYLPGSIVLYMRRQSKEADLRNCKSRGISYIRLQRQTPISVMKRNSMLRPKILESGSNIVP